METKGNGEMEQSGERNHRIETLRQRMSLFYEAIQRINESLDFESVLQEVVDNARDLTGACYGVMRLARRQCAAAGGSSEQRQKNGGRAAEAPRGDSAGTDCNFKVYLNRLPGPLQGSQPGRQLDRGTGEARSSSRFGSGPFLSAPIRYQPVGNMSTSF